MPKQFAYYPGCALHGTAREYEVSTRLVCQRLGVELQEVPGWVCCGASSAHTLDARVAVALPALELHKAEKMGLPLLAPCAMCFSRLSFAACELQEPGKRAEVEDIIGERLEKLPSVWHLLQLLAQETIPVQRPLEGLKVASYYGCLLVRPPRVAHLDDVENPTIMDRIVQATGAEAVPWAFKTECCGGGLTLPLYDTVLRLSYRVLTQAREAGAEVVAVACPMCQSNLDLYQREMARRYGDHIGMPVVYISQLVGLALGLSPRELWLDRHGVSPLALLQGKGLV